jgi:hypothetical protein
LELLKSKIMKKKFFLLFAVLLSMTLQAAAPWDGTTIAASYAGGTGTSGDPYQISTPEQLAYLSQSVTGGTNYFNNYFILTSDLDLNSKSWTPIGNSTSTNQFRGTFDGKSHVISNLNVNVATSNAGLFGVAQYAKIMNVGIVGTSTVTGAGSVGAIVGLVTGAGATAFSMSGCFSNASVSSGSGQNAGGIVGYFNNTTGTSALSSITNCYSTGNISGDSYVAGIVGRANGVAASLTISNSYATGTITARTGTNGIAKITVSGTGTITVTNCFYINGYLQTGATVKTAADMKLAAFVTSLNDIQSPAPWIADWTGGNINGGYPILKPFISMIPATVTAFTTTYGTASAAQSFSVSGSYLGANIVAYAPNSGTGYEVSSNGTNYATTATFTKSGSTGSASGTLYIRLKATATVSGTYNSLSTGITSAGSTSAYINTTATGNAVSAKALTITAGNQTVMYGTDPSAVTGAGTYTPTGFANSETASVVGGSASYSTTYTNSTAVGTAGVSITPIVTSLTAANYSFTPVAGTVTVATLPDAPTIGTATAGNTRVSVAFTAPANDGGSPILDYTVTPYVESTPGTPVTGSGSPIVVTGLSNGTAYTFSVTARNAVGSSVASSASNPVTPDAITNNIIVSSATDISTLTLTPVSDIVVSSNRLTIDQSIKVNSITAAPGAELSITAGTITATNGIKLQSSPSGTATLVDNYSTPTVVATVQQYLPQGRNWYVASPIESTTTPAAATSLIGGGLASSVSYYDETANGTVNAWINNYTGSLLRGIGYVAVSESGAGTNNVTVSGTLNSGDVPVTLTRTGTGGFEGYNLIGNPYPSYVNPMAALNALDVEKTIWYRTKGSTYKFETVNTLSGVGTDAALSGQTVTGYIPPMQAFWVRTNTNGQVLTFNNAMRNHANPVVGGTTINTTLLKAPKQVLNSIARLRINGTAGTDETVLYFNTAASNEFDNYDSRKKFESASAVTPEIFTQVGTEKLAINGLNAVEYETELPVGFVTKQAGDFSISLGELSNFETGTRLILKDNQQPTAEIELTPEKSYNFSTTSATNTAGRFSLLFRTATTITQVENAGKLNAQVYVNAARQITIVAHEKCNYTIYNTVGQKLNEGLTTSNRTALNIKLQNGIYVVRLIDNGKELTTRIIIK